MGEKSMCLNLESIMDYVLGDVGSNRTKDVEITEDYEYDNVGNNYIPSHKQVKEVKVTDIGGQTTRYDLVKTLMDVLDTVEVDMNGAPMDMSLGQILALNTMLSYEFINEVKINDVNGGQE